MTLETATYSYRPRPLAVVASAALHGLLIAMLAYMPTAAQEQERLPRFQVITIPSAPGKIIWYSSKRQLPEIAPTRPVGESKQPRGRVFSRDTLIAMPEEGRAGKQLIWEPAPTVQLAQEIPAPNLIILKSSVLPPPKPRPRPFTPPRVGEPIRKPKPSLISAPEIAVAGPALDQARLPVAAGLPAPTSPGENIFGEAPPEVAGASNGGGNVNMAIIGLQPADRLEAPLPAGSRPGQFSQAPTVGEPSTGSGDGKTGIRIPGVAVRGSLPAPPPAPTVPKAGPRKLLVEMGVPAYAATLAAPLRPFARTVPGAVEARFARRIVYTLVIQQPHMPMYTGDWVMWFAEKQERPGETPQMRPPAPVRKYEVFGNGAEGHGAPAEGYVQLAATIQRDGKLSDITLAGKDPAGIATAAMQDLAEWEFRPAMRNGEPVDVEMLVEIPYRLAGR